MSDSKAKYSVRYKVVEAKDLSTSHKIGALGVETNENYKGIQPRDRTRADQQAQIIETANKFDPDQALDTAMSVNHGAAVVEKDGTVLNGNRRTIALQYAYENNDRGELYKNALIERAEEFGLNADEISKMNQPVLVREFAEDLAEEQREDVADTTAGGSGMSASEQAKSDAKKLPSNLFSNIPLDEVINFRASKLSSASKDLLTDVLKAVATPEEITAYTQEDGTIGKQGIERAEQAIIAHTYPNDKITARMAEATDNDIKTVSNALLGAAPSILRVRQGMKNGVLHKYDLNAIGDAVEKFATLKKQGKSLKEYREQGTLTDEKLSAEADEILSFLDANNRSEKKITEFLNGIADEIQKQGNPNQATLFGAKEPAPLIDLIKNARAQVENGQSIPLFSLKGNADTRIENFVEDKDLTPQQRLLKSFGEKLGVKTKFFRNENGDFHGAHAGGINFFNVNSKMPLEKVFWHESMHWLKANNPKLYQQLVKAAGITDAQREAYLEKTKRTDLKSDVEIDEEILADAFEDVAKRTGLLQNIAGKNRSLIERVIQWLKDTMNKFVEHFRNPQGKLTTTQAQKLADEFGRIAKDLTDSNGQKIFRYNRSTRNIELADGRELAENKQVTTSGEKVLSPRNRVRELLKPLRGKPITNKATGIVATIGRTGVEKMVSNRAVDKSVANGYTEAQHLEAAANIKKLYEEATLSETFADKKGSPHLASIKRFNCDTTVGGDKASAKITVKENIFDGHKIYSIELEELNKPAELKNRTGTDSSAGSEDSTQNNLGNATGVHYAEESSDENIAQSGDKIKYSIDNSGESLKGKIQNKMSGWFSEPNTHRNKKITENLRRLSGHRILYGYVKGADDIVVDHMQKLIQSRHSYDWEQLLPVVGKEIAKNLKINPTAEQSNYIADWLLTGALNNQQSVEGKALAKAMRENPPMAELLQNTRDLFQKFQNMTPQERIASTIKNKQSKPYLERIKAIKENFTEEILDDLNPLQEIVDKAVKESTPEMAELIKQGVNVKELAQISRGKGAIANLMVNGEEKDVENIRQSLGEQYTGVDFSEFKPITAIIESVGGDWEGLQIYALAKLNKEFYEHNCVFPDDQITPSYSEEDCDAVIRDGEKKFGQAQKDLVHFSNTLVAMLADSGVISQEQFENTVAKWKNYVPMARVFDENEEYDASNMLKSKKGSKRDTWSPIQRLMVNAHKIIQTCERNKVKLELATLVRFGNFDSNISEVLKGDPNIDNIITFRENGVTKYLETPDPAIKRAVDSLQSKAESDWFTKLLRAISGFMRAAYTMSNPDFAAGNMFRDLPDAYIHNKYLGNTAPITDIVRAWLSSVKELWTGNGQDLIDWQMNGGAQASFVSGDVDYIQRSINDATTTRLQRYKRNPVAQMLDDFQKLSEFTENVTRLTTYKLAKNRIADGKADITAKQIAALVAREASIDFAKAGHSVRKLNKHVLFANAAVQSLNQWIEASRLAAKGDTKLLFGKIFRAAMHGIGLALLQFAFSHGDDDRKKEYEQAPDWEKETYWIFGGFRIPKGFDVGTRIFANLTDEFLSFVADKKPIEIKRIVGTPLWNALPSLTATAITPAVEVALNKSFFRDAPIVPQREQHLDASEQYDANTSEVAKLFGQMTGWSPRKLDYLINGYLGFMGRFATHIPNYWERGIGWDEAPMIRRFIFEPYKNPKSVKEFYEAYEEQSAHHNTYKLRKEKPEGYDPKLYKRLKSVQESMSKISKLEKKFLDDPNLTYDERKEKLRELEKKRIALCERALK